jgi:hypothetical protein
MLEDVAVQKLCAFQTSPQDLTLVSRFEFKRADAFPCISQILKGLNNLRLAKEQKLTAGQQLIWNLASLLKDPGGSDSEVRNIIIPILRAVAEDQSNPMHGHAWLALTYVDKVDFKSGTDAVEQLGKLEESLLLYSEEELQKKAESEHRAIRTPDYYFESVPPPFVERLSWFVAETYNAAIDPTVRSTDQIPYGFKGLMLFSSLNLYPADVVQRYVISQMKNTRLISASTPQPQPKSIEDMAFTIDQQLCAGRGGCIDIPQKKSASLFKDFQWKGWLSPNGGTQSDSWVAIDALQTIRAPQQITFTGGIRSYARGGFRNASLLESSEDETSSVKLTISGTTTIPQCPSPASCSQVYQGSFNLLNDEASGRVSVIINQAGISRGLTRGETFLLDVSKTPADLAVSITRTFQHATACCEPPPLPQAFTLAIWEPTSFMSGVINSLSRNIKQQDSNALQQSSYLAVHSLLRMSGARIQNSALYPYFPFGELLSDLRLINPSEFSKRSWGIYLRLCVAKFLLAQSDFNLTGLERQSIQTAQNYLSTQARLLYLDTVTSELKDKSALVQAFDPTLLDKAVAALLKGESIQNRPNPVLLDQIRALERLGAFQDSETLRKTLEAYDRAILADNALEAVIDLMEFRRNYLLTLGRLKEQVQALAIERSQLEGPQQGQGH